MISTELRQQIKDRIKDPAFAVAADALAQDIYDAWQTSDPDETDKREEMYQRYRVLVDTIQKLQDLTVEGIPLDQIDGMEDSA